MRAAPKPLAELDEKELGSLLFGRRQGVATTLGWQLVYHTLRSQGSEPGFPDYVLARERVIFVELKREKRLATPITEAQIRWLTGLATAGAEVYLWRPSDFDEAGRVLGRRQLFRQPGLLELGSGRGMWHPASLWLPAGCRADEHAAKAV